MFQAFYKEWCATLIELDKLTWQACHIAPARDYGFEVVHCVVMTNIDANGFSRNPSPSDEDLTGAR